MAGKYNFSSEEIAATKEVRRKNKDKRADTRLKALELRAEGMKSKEVSQAIYILSSVLLNVWKRWL